jgi:hypothetical protein
METIRASKVVTYSKQYKKLKDELLEYESELSKIIPQMNIEELKAFEIKDIEQLFNNVGFLMNSNIKNQVLDILSNKNNVNNKDK